MIRIIHPISGEQGYFCSESEKEIIDAIIRDSQSSLPNVGVSVNE